MTRWTEAQQRLDEFRPATDELLGQLVDGAFQMREHDHPREDFFCLNLASYGGEKLPTVLRRLRDAERQLAALDDVVTAFRHSRARGMRWERGPVARALHNLDRVAPKGEA